MRLAQGIIIDKEKTFGRLKFSALRREVFLNNEDGTVSTEVRERTYDNAVAESTYKSFKAEFVYPNTFDTLNQLKLQLFDYVNWWNYLRLHGTLGYETPISIRNRIR